MLADPEGPEVGVPGARGVVPGAEGVPVGAVGP